VLVLEQDAQRDVLGLGVIGEGFRDGDADRVAGGGGVARLGGLAVAEDEVLADQLLDAGARQLGDPRGQEGIEAGAGIAFHADFHERRASRRAGGAVNGGQ